MIGLFLRFGCFRDVAGGTGFGLLHIAFSSRKHSWPHGWEEVLVQAALSAGYTVHGCWRRVVGPPALRHSTAKVGGEHHWFLLKPLLWLGRRCKLGLPGRLLCQ